MTLLAADAGERTKSAPTTGLPPPAPPVIIVPANPDRSSRSTTPASTPAPVVDPAVPVDPSTPPLANPVNPTLPDGSPLPPFTTVPLIPPINANGTPPKLTPRDKVLPPVPTKADAAERASEVESQIGASRIGLLDAVRITLLKNPAIKLNAEDVAQAKAILRIATGQFDFNLGGTVQWSYQQNELPLDQALQQENAFHKMQIQRSATAQTIAITESNIKTLNAGKDPVPDTSGIADAKQRADANAQNQINQQIQDLTNQIVTSVATPAQQQQLNMIKTEGRALSANVENDLLTGLKGSLNQLNKQIEQFPPITVRRTETTTYQFSLLKEFRNGISFGPFVSYNRSNDNFTSRTGIGDLGTSNVGLEVIVPLGRGSGAAASAQERSSAVDLEASRLTLQHIASQSVLQTIQSYWNVVAAQERLRLLFRSELIAGALVDLSRELIKADELAASEISQIEGQRAIRASQRISAEQDLVTATQNLAVAMGLDVREIVTAPLAAEPFPEALSAAQLDKAPRQVLAMIALENRSDRLAAIKMQVSGKILVDAARINLRPTVGLQVRTSYSSNTESSKYESYLWAYDREHGPSVSAALSLAWPLENNAARGQYQQATSSYNQTLIQTDQLSRSIVSNVVIDLSAIQRGREQIDKSQQSADGFEKALETEREKLKLGNSTLINTIETEQNLTNALLQVVAARQQYASALAQLRFDTGTLLPHNNRTVFGRQDFVTLPPVSVVNAPTASPLPTRILAPAPTPKAASKPVKKK